MNSKVSFEGIGEISATFYADEGVKAGEVVKLSGDSRVAPCGSGERFCGVALSERTGCAAVQVGGFVRVACADSGVTVGVVKLNANGTGGVKKAGGSEAGEEYLVVAKTADAVTLRI